MRYNPKVMQEDHVRSTYLLAGPSILSGMYVWAPSEGGGTSQQPMVVLQLPWNTACVSFSIA